MQDLHPPVRRRQVADLEQHLRILPTPRTTGLGGRGGRPRPVASGRCLGTRRVDRAHAGSASAVAGDPPAPRGPEIRLEDGGVLLDLRGGSGGDDASVVQHGDPVRDAHHEVHVVADQEDRGARRAEPRDEVGEAGDLLLRESRGRLVEQEHRGPPGERPRDLDQALVTERQVPRERVGVAGVAHEGEEPARFRAEPPLARAHGGRAEERRGERARPAAEETHQHVLEHAQRLEEARGLERPRDPRARDAVGPEPGERARAEGDDPRGRPVEAAQDVEERRLAGAVRSDEAVDAPRRQRQVAVGERDDPAEAHLEAAGLERRGLGGPGPPRDGLGGVRVAAPPPVTRQRAHHAAGQEVDGSEEQPAVHHEAVVREAVQELRKDDQHDRPDDRPEHPPEAAEEDDQEEEDRGLQREAVRAHEAGEEGVETAADRGERRPQREGRRADQVGVEAERRRGELAVADGEQRPAPRRPAEVPRQGEAREHGEPDDVVVAPERERRASETRARDVGDPAEAAGERVPLDQAVLDDDAERDRHHRQVGSRDAQRGEAEDGADHDAEQGRHRQREPEGEPGARGDERAGVRAERVEARLPERHLARGAGEHVEAGRDDDADADQDRDKQVVRVARDERDQRGDGEGERAGGPRHGYTRRGAATPKRPHGRASSTRTTSAKPRISRTPVPR